MNNVVNLNKPRIVAGSNMEIIGTAWLTNATGSIVYVLCKDLTMGYTMCFFGVGNPSHREKSEITVAQLGHKVSLAEVTDRFGSQENYKYR